MSAAADLGWLAPIKAAAQLTTIRGFSGQGHVVSISRGRTFCVQSWRQIYPTLRQNHQFRRVHLTLRELALTLHLVCWLVLCVPELS